MLGKYYIESYMNFKKNMNNTPVQIYSAPRVKVMDVLLEGVLCQSGETGGTGLVEEWDEESFVW